MIKSSLQPRHVGPNSALPPADSHGAWAVALLQDWSGGTWTLELSLCLSDTRELKCAAEQIYGAACGGGEGLLLRQARDGSSFSCVFLAANCQGGASVASLSSTGSIQFYGPILCSLSLWHVSSPGIPSWQESLNVCSRAGPAIVQQAPPACISLFWFDCREEKVWKPH